MLQISSINRFQAFACHIGISAVIAGLSAGLVYFIWYPGMLAEASTVTNIFLLLLAIDVVLGPVITFIIFNPAKKELKRDLIIVFFIQVAALVYGIHTLFVARPAYVVYNAAGFDLVYANQIKEEDLKKASAFEYQSLPFSGPQVIAAQLPADHEVAQGIVNASLFGGSDIQHLPQYYLPYQKQKDEVIQLARPLNELEQANPRKKQEVFDLINKYQAEKVDAGYLPLRAGMETYVVTINKASGEVIELVDLQSRRTFPKQNSEQQQKQK